MTNLYHPLDSLRQGHWFKLICGASFQHLPAVRNLSLAFTLAGADCIDVAADPAVIAVAQEGIQAATQITRQLSNELSNKLSSEVSSEVSNEVSNELSSATATSNGIATDHQWKVYNQVYSQKKLFRRTPWLMVSLNDGEDPHFRKAEFNPAHCPPDCARPCATICPAQAIVFRQASHDFSGVLNDRCYGCGRCLPICPVHHISTRAYVSAPEIVAPLILKEVDAVEIHTQVGRLQDFQRLWQAILPWIQHLKLISISCPDGEGLIDYLQAIHSLIAPLPCALIWQTDGRPMSGDIGDGATRAAVKLGQKVLSAGLPGYVQLAGGTNGHTVGKLEALGLLRGQSEKNLMARTEARTDPSIQFSAVPPSSSYIAGIAYGSSARVLLSPVLDQLETRMLQKKLFPPGDNGEVLGSSLPDLLPQLQAQPDRLEAFPELLWQAVELASSLVSQLKAPGRMRPAIATVPGSANL